MTAERHAHAPARRDRDRSTGDRKRDEKRTEEPPRAAPTPSQRQVLLLSALDAARLPLPCTDLIAALKQAAESPEESAATKGKRNRAEAGNEVVSGAEFVQRLWDALKPHTSALLTDEVGVRLLEALIRSAGTVQMPVSDADDTPRTVTSECIEAVLDAAGVEEEAAEGAEEIDAEAAAEADEARGLVSRRRIRDLYAMATNSTSRGVVLAAIECGERSQRKRLNRALAAEALNLAVDRHGVQALMLLMEHYPKSRATIVPALLPIVESTLMADPIGAKTAITLIHPDSAADIADHILNSNKLEETITESGMQYPWTGPQKRTVRFATALLKNGLARQSTDDNVDADRRGSMLARLYEAVSNRIVPLATHSHGNFFVQALVRGLSSWAPRADTDAALQHAIKLFTKCAEPSLGDLAAHPCGSHVVGALACCASTSIAGALRPHLLTLATEKHGSIALRRLIENAGTPQQAAAVADALLRSLAQNTPSIVRDVHGNLLIQSILKAIKPAERTRFFDSFIKPEAVPLSMHVSASHVVHALISGGEASMESAALTIFFGCVKKQLIDLATHINGRFIVEALIGPYREAQQLLADNFATLAVSKGAQQILVRLYQASSQSVKEQLIAYVGNHLAALAVQQQGSLTLQKLMQADAAAPSAPGRPSVLATVKQFLKTQPQQANRLRTDFFGRFVVQITEADGAARS